MKTKIVKTLLIAGLVTTSSIALAGCKSVTIEDYTIVGHNETYEVNQAFSIEDLKLHLKMSNGSTKVIGVTKDMIVSMPNMSTPGEKTVVIRYDGKEYYLTFDVVPLDPSKQIISITQVVGIKTTYILGATSVELEPLAKVIYLTSDLQSKSAELTLDMISGFDASTTGRKNLTVTFEGHTFNVSYKVVSNEQVTMQEQLQKFLEIYNNQSTAGDITTSVDINGIFKYLNDTAEISKKYSYSLNEKEVTQNKELYDALVRGIINSTLTNGVDLNAENMTSTLDVAKSINTVYKSLKNIDYYDLIINQNLLTEEDYYYNALVRDSVCDFLSIKNEKGKDKVYYLSFKTLYKIRNQEEIDVVSVIKELNDIATTYAEDTAAKHTLNGLIDIVEAYVESNGSKHALSHIIANAEELFYYEEYNVETGEWEHKDTALSSKFAQLLSKFVYELESISETTSYKNSVDSIHSCLEDLIDLKNEIGFKKDRFGREINNYLSFYEYETYLTLLNGIEKARFAEIALFIDSVKDNNLVEYIANTLTLNGEAVSLIFDYVDSKIKDKDMDYEKFIVDYCVALDVNPVPYLQEYRNVGHVQVITIGLRHYINSLDKEIVAEYDIFELAKYLDSLQTNEIDADTLIIKVSNILSAISDSFNGEPNIYDILADMTSYGASYKGILGCSLDYLIDRYVVPEGANNYTVNTETMKPALHFGETVTVQQMDEYDVGDIIVHDEGKLYSRVLAILNENNETYYLCDTDDNESWMTKSSYLDAFIRKGKTLDEIKFLSEINFTTLTFEEITGKVIGINKYPIECSKEFANKIKDYLLSGCKSYTTDELIDIICEEFDLDFNTYLKNYRETGVCYILREVFDDYYDLESIEDENEKAMLTNLRKLAVYIDETMMGNFNVNEFKDIVYNLAETSITHIYEKGYNYGIYKLLKLSTSESAKLVKDLVVNGSENYDVEKLIIAVCNDFGLDQDKYLDRYREFGTCYALREAFDTHFDLSAIEDENEKAMLEDVRELAVYIDESIGGEFDEEELRIKLHNLTESAISCNFKRYTLELDIASILTSESAKLVRDLLVNGSENYDVEKLIITVCNDFGLDQDKYLSRYHEFGTCYALREAFDTHFDLSTIEDENEKAMLTDLREICCYADEIFVNEFNKSEALALVNDFANSAIVYFGEESTNGKLFKLLDYASMEKSVDETIKLIIDNNTETIVDYLIKPISKLIKIEEDSIEFETLRNILTSHVESYVAGDFDVDLLIEDIFGFIDANCEDDVKKYSNSVSALVGVLLYDETVDYNEILGFIELPDGMEPIDYNKLLKSLNVDEYIALVNKIAKYGLDYKSEGEPYLETIFKVAYYGSLNKSLDETMKIFVDDNSYDIKSILLDELSSILLIENGSTEYEKMNFLITTHIDNYLNDNFDATEMFEDLFSYIDENCSDEVKARSTTAAVLIGLTLYDEEVDYNKLLGVIPLPEGMEPIDYNKLFKNCSFETYVELINKVAKYGVEYKSQNNHGLALIFNTLYYSTLNESFAGTLKAFVGDYSQDIVTAISDILSGVLQIEYPSDEYLELKSLVEKHVNSYLIDQIDVSCLAQDLYNFVNENCSEEVQTYSKSLVVLVGALLYDESIDYNKLLSFIELPEGIDSIDYNKLFNKIISENTYKLFNVSNVETQHVVENGKLVKEVITLKFELSYDFMVLAAAQADMILTIEIAL